MPLLESEGSPPPSPDGNEPASGAEAGGSALVKCSVLVIEDDPLQALELEEIVRDLGCRVLGPVATKAEAIRLIRGDRPNVALLDVVLPDGDSVPVAKRLAASDVPFGILSGQAMHVMADPAFRGAPLLAKPYSSATVRELVRMLYVFDLAAALSRIDERLGRLQLTMLHESGRVRDLSGAAHDRVDADQLLSAHEHTRAILKSRRSELLGDINRQGAPTADLSSWPLLGPR
jgi:CheY-like chemotaxis protein